MEEKTEFSFDELSDDAKRDAIDKARYDEVSDNDWADLSYDDFIAVGAILGISISMRQVRTMANTTIDHPAIYWSGFCSQGDGASFEGEYMYAPEASEKIREHAPQDEELHRLADELTALQVQCKLEHAQTILASIKCGHHRIYPLTLDCSLSDDTYFANVAPEEGALKELMESFAAWIYKQLEGQHDYLTSDECVAERLSESDLKFDEDGCMI